jgi:hypothetical protein
MSITFNATNNIIRGEFVDYRGVLPGTGFIDVPMGDVSSVSTGTLTFSDETTSRSFENVVPGRCFVVPDGNGFGMTDAAPFVRITLYDRRKNWENGSIRGEYNARNVDGTKRNTKSVAELMDMLLTQMGETGYSTSAAPTDVYPHVNWEHGANPAYALESLAHQCGCDIVLGADNKVKVVALDESSSLSGTSIYPECSITIADGPSHFRIVGGPKVVSGTLKLEAVGQDVDGTIKPIDELSYKPDQGWSKQDPRFFSGVQDLLPRELAFRTVYKWYRVAGQADGSLNIPGIDSTVNSVDQLKMLEYSALADGVRPLPVAVKGLFYPWSDADVNIGSNGNQDLYPHQNPAIYKWNLTWHPESQLVILDRPMVKIKATPSEFLYSSEPIFYEPADLFIDCSYSVFTDNTLSTLESYEKSFDSSGAVSSGSESATQIIRRPDLSPVITHSYSSLSALPSATDNSAQIDNEAVLAAKSAAQYSGGTVQHKFVPSVVNSSLNGFTAMARFVSEGKFSFTEFSTVKESDPGTMSRDSRHRARMSLQSNNNA